MIGVVVETMLPGRAYRCNETFHPYTVNGLEVEVQVVFRLRILTPFGVQL
jgi:hypothetical protein